MNQNMYTNNGPKRVMAFCVDLCIIAITFLCFTAITDKIGSLLGNILCYSTVLLYIVLPNLIFSKSLGKVIVKINVLNHNDNTVNKFKLALRDVLKYVLSIFTFGAYTLICGIMVISRKDELAIHDIIFKTHIIDPMVKQRIEEKKNKNVDPYEN